MLNKTKIELLEKLYHDKSHGFTSPVKLWRRTKKIAPNISLSDINKYLSTVPASARHKAIPKPKASIWNRFIHYSYPGELVAVDTWYLGPAIKSQFPFAIVAVDGLSKIAAVAPLRILKGKNSAKAMDKIIQNFKFKITSVLLDRGPEFVAHEFRNDMKDKGIKIIYTQGSNPSKTALAESLIRTLRIIVGRITTAGVNKRGWETVKQAVEIYNNSPHSSIGNRAPNSVTTDNYPMVLKTILEKRRDYIGKHDPKRAPPKFEKNDIVRKLELDKKGAFDKINLPGWSKTLYRIEKVIPTMARPSYVLSDPLSGAILPGSFAEKTIQLRHNLKM